MFMGGAVARRGLEKKMTIFEQQAPVAAPVSRRDALYMAAIDCGHRITEDKIILYLDARREGNALSQLADRLAAVAAHPADAAAVAAELTGEQRPADCSGDPSSCPDNEGYGCHCDDVK
jgi:hypothetical protein